MAERRQHDLGGTPGGPIDTAEHVTAPWAKLLTATVGALRQKDLIRVDELRRSLEDLPAEQYDMGYFERWAEALCNFLEEEDILTHEEVAARMAEIKKELEAGA